MKCDFCVFHYFSDGHFHVDTVVGEVVEDWFDAVKICRRMSRNLQWGRCTCLVDDLVGGGGGGNEGDPYDQFCQYEQAVECGQMPHHFSFHCFLLGLKMWVALSHTPCFTPLYLVVLVVGVACC